MVELLVNVVVPLIIAGVLISLVFSIIKMILDLFRIDFYLIKLILFFVAYYFIGEYVFNLLTKYLSNNISIYIKFLYEPIQIIMSYIS